MTQDPRSLGFNYGAPIAEPQNLPYWCVKHAADFLRKRNSAKARAYSWQLDMLLRDVRISCSVDEQISAVDKLLDFVSGTHHRLGSRQCKAVAKLSISSFLAAK